MTTTAVVMGSILALLLVVYLLMLRQGRVVARAEREKVRADRAEVYVETRKEMDDAEVVGDDPAAARRWLTERARRGPSRNGRAGS